MSSATASSQPLRIERRPVTRDLEGLVYKTWLLSYRSFARVVMWEAPHGQKPRAAARWMDADTYFAEQHRAIEDILSRTPQPVLVAGDPDDANTHYGYAITEGAVLHYVFVKDAFRRFGIARRLLEMAAPTEFSHWTEDGAALLTRCRPGLKHNPHRIHRGVHVPAAAAAEAGAAQVG